MTSSRLPGKVLENVGGVPMLQMMIERLKQAQTLSAICVATTENAPDDPMEELAHSLDVGCFRGSEEDVLARVLGAARAESVDLIVETTGDCPMIDPGVLDACVLAYFTQDFHYCGNHLVESFPRGLDVKVFATDLLAEVAALTQDPADREHVSLYIYEHSERYRIVNVQAAGALARPDWRWTVDTADDLAFVRAIVEVLGRSFTAAEAAALLQQRPDVVAINSHIEQKPVR
jgi:spore coat polysaccharide biosynthesis protein SpsF